MMNETRDRSDLLDFLDYLANERGDSGNTIRTYRSPDLSQLVDFSHMEGRSVRDADRLLLTRVPIFPP